MKKIGVFGVGHLGQIHCKCINESDKAELCGIYDVNLPHAKEVAENLGVPCFEKPEQLLEICDIADVVCTTIHHYEMAKLAMQHHKPVFIEKPVTATVKEAEELLQLSKTLNIPVQVGHVERFNPAFIAAKNKIRQPMFIEGHRLALFNPRVNDVSVILDLMIHDIDIVANAICDSDASDVKAFGKYVYGEKFVDYATAALTFPNGVLAFITASRCTEDKIRKICLHAKGSYIEGDLLNRTLVVKRSASFDERGIVPHSVYSQYNITEHIVLPNEEPLKQEMIEFGKCIHSHTIPIVNSKQVLRSMSILERIEDSIYNGGLW